MLFCLDKKKEYYIKTGDINVSIMSLIAGSLEAAYSLNWGAREIWGKGGGETLALL